MQEMDAELERYHKSCAALDLNASEGRLKHNALHKEVARQRTQTQSAQQAIRYSTTTALYPFCAMSQTQDVFVTVFSFGICDSDRGLVSDRLMGCLRVCACLPVSLQHNVLHAMLV